MRPIEYPQLWALACLVLALLSAICFGQTLGSGHTATSALLFGDWLVATAWLFFFRVAQRNGGRP